MPVKMMQVRRMRVTVNQCLMKMAMAVRFLPVAGVFVTMMLIMNMTVFMKNSLMFVLMVVIFSH